MIRELGKYHLQVADTDCSEFSVLIWRSRQSSPCFSGIPAGVPVNLLMMQDTQSLKRLRVSFS